MITYLRGPSGWVKPSSPPSSCILTRASPWTTVFVQHGKSTICSLELLTALCALLTMRDSLRNRRVYLYVDNTAAWSCMITATRTLFQCQRWATSFTLKSQSLGSIVGSNGSTQRRILQIYLPDPSCQREQLYTDRPVFKQRSMAFPSLSDYTNLSSLFFRLKSE